MLPYITIAISLFCGIVITLMTYLLNRTINENDRKINESDRKIDMFKQDLKEIEKEVRECKNAIAVNNIQQTERLASIADKLKDMAEDKRSNPSINTERNITRRGIK